MPFTVSQLPFHEMSAYPYPEPEEFPDAPASLAYQLNWNNRFDSGEPTGLHLFDYELHPSTPRDDFPAAAKPGVQP